VAPDLIGWGQSSHPVRTYWVEDYFTMITQLLTSLEGPRLVVPLLRDFAGMVLASHQVQ